MEERKYYCRVCRKEIHRLRAKLGYTQSCVEHSKAEKYTGIISSVGNSDDYEMQIIKDPEIAKKLVALSSNIY
jgi:hypothetical protein